MKYESGNSALLIEYRDMLLKAYKLGEDIKKLYGIVPPTVFHEVETENSAMNYRLSLNVH